MPSLVERFYFALCRPLAWLLRSARYTTASTAGHAGKREVRKRRRFYAPLLIWMSEPLVRLLNTGVRVLVQREWEERERRVYWSVHGRSIRIEAGGVLVLPCFVGRTLANVLEDPAIEESARKRAIERAVVALADFHHLGLTHGDAMAENVVVDIDSGSARWIDFETVHDPERPIAWRRADDVRALLVTCLVRTRAAKVAETLELIVDTYMDEDVTRVLTASFASSWQRPLTFHLAQARLSFQCFREVGRLLRVR